MASRSIHIRKISGRRAQRNKFRRDLYIPVSIANRRLPVIRPRYDFFNDLRTFHPQRSLRPLQTVSGGRALVYRPRRVQPRGQGYRPPRALSPHWEVVFKTPASTIVCVRRGQRKEVLHALGKTGKRGQKRPRFNEQSRMLCRKV